MALWGEAAHLVSCRGGTPIPASLLNSCVTLGGHFFSTPFKKSSIRWKSWSLSPGTVEGYAEVTEQSL